MRKKHPKLASQLLDDYIEPDESFRAQWSNLFDVVFYDGLSHQSLLQYQRKFEIELPLRFLATIRELSSTGGFDPALSRFRDRSGNLKKGVVAQYIKDGFKAYPALASVVGLAYHAKLRNAIGHNAYAISEGHFRSLDGDVTMKESEFVRRLDALQALQNAVIWLFMSRFDEDRSSLKSGGVLAIAWGWLGNREEAHLSIFQLAPFYSLDEKCEWLHKVVLKHAGDQLITRLGNAPLIEGPIPNTLEPLLEEIRQSHHVYGAVIPIMPCIHQHTPYVLPQGDFCQVVEGVEGTVPVEVAA